MAAAEEVEWATKRPLGLYAAVLVVAVVEAGVIVAMFHAAERQSWQLFAGATCGAVMMGALLCTFLIGAIHAHPTRRVYNVDPEWIPQSRWSVVVYLLLLPAALAMGPAIGFVGAGIYPDLTAWGRFVMFIGFLAGVGSPFLFLWYARKAQRSGAHLSLLDEGLQVRTPVGKQYFITKAQLPQTTVVIKGSLQVVLYPPEGSRAITIALINYGPTPSSVLHALLPYLINKGARIRNSLR